MAESTRKKRKRKEERNKEGRQAREDGPLAIGEKLVSICGLPPVRQLPWSMHPRSTTFSAERGRATTPHEDSTLRKREGEAGGKKSEGGPLPCGHSRSHEQNFIGVHYFVFAFLPVNYGYFARPINCGRMLYLLAKKINKKYARTVTRFKKWLDFCDGKMIDFYSKTCMVTKGF